MTNRIAPSRWPFASFDPFGFSFRVRALAGSLSMSAISMTGALTAAGSRSIAGSLDMSAIALTGSMVSSAPTINTLNGSLDMSAVSVGGALVRSRALVGSLDMSAVSLGGALVRSAGTIPAFSDVRVLANFDTNTNNIVGNVAMSSPGTTLTRRTSPTKFGAGSYGLVVANGGNGVEYAASPGPRWAYTSIGLTEPMTVEGWVYIENSLDITIGATINLNSGGTAYLTFSGADDGAGGQDWSILGILNGAHTPAGFSNPSLLGTWVHFALVREANGQERVYVNGTRVENFTGPENNTSTCDRFEFISATITSQSIGGTSPCNGGSILFDDIRVSKAVVYTGASFTVPASAYPTS